MNNITSLRALRGCLKLKELYLRKNNIADINELYYLQDLPELQVEPAALTHWPHFTPLFGLLDALAK